MELDLCAENLTGWKEEDQRGWMGEERSVEMRVGNHGGGTNWVALPKPGVADPLRPCEKAAQY